MQTGPERCIFQYPTGTKLGKVCKTSEEGNTLRIQVPMFWTRSSTTVTYKVIENSNITSEKYQHQSDNISTRYGYDLDDMLVLSHTIQEAHMSREKVIYLLQSFCFIINIKKSTLHPCRKIELLVMEKDSIKLTLSLTAEKVQNLSGSAQESFYKSSGID